MKLLIAIILSSVVSVSAFGACSTDKLGECTSDADCVALSKEGGVQYEFIATSTTDPKKVCRTKDTAKVTDCFGVDDTSRGSGATAVGLDGKPAPVSKTGNK